MAANPTATAIAMRGRFGIQDLGGDPSLIGPSRMVKGGRPPRNHPYVAGYDPFDAGAAGGGTGGVFL